MTTDRSQPDVEVSVIVCVSRNALGACVDSLKNQTASSHLYEVIYVPHPPFDSALNAFAPLPSNHIILSTDDPNPAKKRNCGAAKARGRWLAFLDDDAAAPPNWIEHGLELTPTLEMSMAGFGGPNLLFPNAPPDERLTDAVLNTPYIGSGSVAYRPGLPHEGPRKAKIGELHLVNLWVRASDYREAGGLNEHLGYGGEDSEFLYVADKKLKRNFLWVPNFSVLHQRRAFGLAYFRQRIHLRRQSGRLMAACPGIYRGNRTLTISLFLLGAGLLLLLFRPVWALLGFGLYLSALGFLLRSRPAGIGFWTLGLALILHHTAYAAGLGLGVFDGLALRLGRLIGRGDRLALLRRV